MWKVHLECPTPPAYLLTEDVLEFWHCAENSTSKWRNRIGNSARTTISAYV